MRTMPGWKEEKKPVRFGQLWINQRNGFTRVTTTVTDLDKFG
jgi:hypothetical protein